MNQPRQTLWKCPMCETLNNATTKCTMCGYTKVDPFQRPDVNRPAAVNDSDRKLKLAVLIAAIVLAVIVCAGLIYFLYQSNEEDSPSGGESATTAETEMESDVMEEAEEAEAEEEDIYYVINTKHDGINIRSAPTKNSSVVEKIKYADTSVKMKDLGNDQTDEYGFVWHYVELSTTGKTGYVRNDIIKIDE